MQRTPAQPTLCGCKRSTTRVSRLKTLCSLQIREGVGWGGGRVSCALLTAAALGGSIGVLAGMYLVRHKTRHLKFAIGVPFILIVQLVLVFQFMV